MLRKLFVAAVAVAVVAGAAVAADPIKVELKDFKVKPTFDGGADLAGHNEGEGKLFFYVNGTATADVKIPEDGEYVVVLEMSCDEAKNEKAKVKVKVGDAEVKDKFELTTADPKEYKFDVKLKKGDAKLTVEFLNDEHKEGEFDRNFYLHAAKIEKKAK